ncbi:MAG: aspartate kinase [Chlamydiales bacterium]|nr:aspartate kinase [Chlamydiales bacterium]
MKEKLPIRVMKFGGASVATTESFHRIADIICQQQEEQIVVVVSAMGKTTDELFRLAKEVHPSPPSRELDMLVSVGERISVALLAMALKLKGKEAVSFTGSQSGIITCKNHSQANIVDVRPKRVLEALQQKKIVIIAGFQGVSRHGEITTLGRGGSDTSAVAMAAAIGVERVYFYKDVDGIYTKDPHLYSNAEFISEMSYDEALSLVQAGAKILQARSIELAKKNGIQLCVRTFKNSNESGTIVGKNVLRNEIIQYEKED